MKNLHTQLFFVFILFLSACTTTTPISRSSLPNSVVEQDVLLSSFCVSDHLRVPASTILCSQSYTVPQTLSPADTRYSDKLRANPIRTAEAAGYSRSQGPLNPIPLSARMQSFRDRNLGFLKLSSVREPLLKSFEGFLRMRGQLTLDRMSQDNKNYGKYDLVIIGAGVHGLVALHSALKVNPKLKALVIDDGDTAGATFRYGKDVFSINSSNRASGEGTRALPGEGNINELPGFPIQVSDLTGVKYPSANDLGATLVSALYAAVREHPGVEVLFNTKAKGFETTPVDANMSESVIVSNSGREFRIDAQRMIVATGLGMPRLPPRVLQTLRNNPSLTSSQPGKLPKVLTFEDVIRLIAESNDPMKFFNDKKIGVAGKGDSAYVFIEYLLGYAPASGYARSSAQTGKVRKISWIGQDKKTCEEFSAEIRSRYIGVSTGYRSSSPNIEAIFAPTANKLVDVREGKRGTVDAILENGENVAGLDYIVVATGFEGNLRALFEAFQKNPRQAARTDSRFLESNFEFLEQTTTINPSPVKVGRQLEGRNIFVLGTAADLFVSESAKEAPAGIVQNFVGIFTNGPRVAAATRKIVAELEPLATETTLLKRDLGSVEEKQTFVITGVQETRYISEQTLPYLEATFKEALSMVQSNSGKKIVLDLGITKEGDLRVKSQTEIDVSPLVKLLVESRDFFALSKELLKLLPNENLRFTADRSESNFNIARARATIIQSKIESETVDLESGTSIVLQNPRIRLRGLEIEAKSAGESSGVKRVSDFYREQGIDLTKPETYAEKAIFIDVPGGDFLVGKDKNVSVTLSRDYKLMASQLSQQLFNRLLTRLRLGNFSTRVEDNSKLPVQNETARSIEQEFLPALNRLSSSKDQADQDFLVSIFPDHVPDRVYSLPTEVQLERVYQLAVTEKGQRIDDIVLALQGERGRSESIANEQLALEFANASRGSVQTEFVAQRRPVFVDGQSAYLYGNIFEFTSTKLLRDSNTSEPPAGGTDPVGLADSSSDYISLRGGYRFENLFSYSRTTYSSNTGSPQVSFRLVAYDP
jgi:hypothetical protein